MVPTLYVMHGTSQRVASIIQNIASCRATFGTCSAQVTKVEQLVKLPVVMSLFTCAQQVSPAHKLLLFSVKLCGWVCLVCGLLPVYVRLICVLNKTGQLYCCYVQAYVNRTSATCFFLEPQADKADGALGL